MLPLKEPVYFSEMTKLFHKDAHKMSFYYKKEKRTENDISKNI